MAWVLILHEVAEYTAWKAAFDAAAPLRRAVGEQRFQVLRADADDRRIVHFSEWSSGDAARRFFESDEVQRIRVAAGVRTPEFHYLEELDRGVLSG